MAYTRATRDGLLPAVKPNKEDARLAKLPTFDLSADLNLLQLAQNLKASLNQHNPSSCLFIWGAERAIKRQELNYRHQREIIAQIENLGLAAEAMARTQAKVFLIPRLVQDIIEGHDREVQLAVKAFKNQMHAHDSEMKARDLMLEKVREEVAQAKANTRITILQGDLLDRQGKLLDKIIKELDINKISPEQAFILVKALNPNANAAVDFASQQVMIEGQLEKMKAEAALKRAEADKVKVQADTDRYAYEAQVREDAER